jgi:hypothetical protein
MTCVFFTINLTNVTYLNICQIEHLVKLDKRNHIRQNEQWLLVNEDI